MRFLILCDLCTANAEHPSFFDDVSPYGRYHRYLPDLLPSGKYQAKSPTLWGRHVRTHPSDHWYRRPSSAHRTPQERVDSVRKRCSEVFFVAIIHAAQPLPSKSSIVNCQWVAGEARAGSLCRFYLLEPQWLGLARKKSRTPANRMGSGRLRYTPEGRILWSERYSTPPG
jgi:hypothetical protein